MRQQHRSAVVFSFDVCYTYFAIPILRVLMLVYALVNVKARKRSALVLNHIFPRVRQRVWFHAASMGEYEQLVPVIDLLKNSDPSISVVVSFFSPSGVEHARRNPHVDAVGIVPFDGRSSMKKFIDALSPSLLVIGRYDLWRNCIVECDARSIPIVLVNATYPSSASYAFLRSWIADTYQRCSYISAVTSADAMALEQLVGEHVQILPDTRVDRILQRIAHPDQSILFLRRTDTLTIVAGSTWPDDEKLIVNAVHQPTSDPVYPPIRYIVVPHEPTEVALHSIERQIPCTRLSKAHPETRGHLLVDSVGSLLSLYAIADAAFVGGGFGDGVHSVTEPAVYGLPIACGPRIERSRDAVDLQSCASLTIVRSSDDLSQWIHQTVCNATDRNIKGSAAQQLMETRSGSSKNILHVLQQLMLSTYHAEHF